MKEEKAWKQHLPISCTCALCRVSANLSRSLAVISSSGSCSNTLTQTNPGILVYVHLGSFAMGARDKIGNTPGSCPVALIEWLCLLWRFNIEKQFDLHKNQFLLIHLCKERHHNEVPSRWDLHSNWQHFLDRD